MPNKFIFYLVYYYVIKYLLKEKKMFKLNLKSFSLSAVVLVGSLALGTSMANADVLSNQQDPQCHWTLGGQWCIKDHDYGIGSCTSQSMSSPRGQCSLAEGASLGACRCTGTPVA